MISTAARETFLMSDLASTIILMFCRLVLGAEKGVTTKGVFSLEESLKSRKSLNSLDSLENGQILLCFPQSGSSPESLNS